MDKPYLREREAAELACVSLMQLRALAAEMGLVPFQWMSTKVHNSAHIVRAMELAECRQSENAELVANNIGRCTGRSRLDDSVTSRLAALEKSNPMKRSLPVSRNRSNSDNVHQLPRAPRSKNG